MSYTYLSDAAGDLGSNLIRKALVGHNIIIVEMVASPLPQGDGHAVTISSGLLSVMSLMEFFVISSRSSNVMVRLPMLPPQHTDMSLSDLPCVSRPMLSMILRGSS